VQFRRVLPWRDPTPKDDGVGSAPAPSFSHTWCQPRGVW
jgi:hypothetical protein